MVRRTPILSGHARRVGPGPRSNTPEEVVARMLADVCPATNLGSSGADEGFRGVTSIPRAGRSFRAYWRKHRTDQELRASGRETDHMEPCSSDFCILRAVPAGQPAGALAETPYLFRRLRQKDKAPMALNAYDEPETSLRKISGAGGSIPDPATVIEKPINTLAFRRQSYPQAAGTPGGLVRFSCKGHTYVIWTSRSLFFCSKTFNYIRVSRRLRPRSMDFLSAPSAKILRSTKGHGRPGVEGRAGATAPKIPPTPATVGGAGRSAAFTTSIIPVPAVLPLGLRYADKMSPTEGPGRLIRPPGSYVSSGNAAKNLHISAHPTLRIGAEDHDE